MVDPVRVIERNYLEKTSSKLNKFICDHCLSSFVAKFNLIKHLRTCGTEIKCSICNINLKNRGNLAAHTKYFHKSLVSTQGEFVCNVCHKEYKSSFLLKQHIRREHFNLISTIPYCELKKINQVWFEKVNNTNTIMEIKKVAQNVLVMRNLHPNTAMKIPINDAPILDVRSVYPTSKDDKAQCDWCQKTMYKRSLAKHIQEKHIKLMVHHCSNCNASFKRLYQLVRHQCFNTKAKKGIKHKLMKQKLNFLSK